MLVRKGRLGEVYNVSASNTVQVKKILQEVQKNLKKEIIYKKNKSLIRKNDEKIIFGDSKKIFKHLKWKQKITFSKTILDMMSYWRKFLYK